MGRFDVPTKVQADAIEARNTLVRHNLKLLAKPARKFCSPTMTFDDAFQAGVIGLMTAATKYDYAKFGARFSTYASYWIFQKIQREGEMSRLVVVPAYIQGEARRSSRDENYEVDPRVNNDYLEAARHSLVFQELGELSHSTARSKMAVYDRDVDDGMDSREKIAKGLKMLDARSRTIVELRFGLTGEAPLTLGEVGDRVGITRERVRQIENVAKAKMKHVINGTAISTPKPSKSADRRAKALRMYFETGASLARAANANHMLKEELAALVAEVIRSKAG